MPPGATLLTFVGPVGDGPLAAAVEAVHRAIALDLVESASFLGTTGAAALVVTADAALQRSLPPWAENVVPQAPFHFGRELARVVMERGIAKPIYVSRGAVPFLGSDGLRRVAERVESADRLVLANNSFSADLVAWTPGSVIAAITPPDADNPLARLLEREAGLPGEEMRRDAVSQFDVDTPADILALAVHPQGGPRTKAAVEALRLDDSHVRAAMAMFTDRTREVIVAGRVSSAAWAYLERETACRVRVFAEERGMKADGREAAGTAHSVLAELLRAVGPDRLFALLAEMGDAAFIDSRVLFASLGLHPSPEDRFASDLLLADRIDDPHVRAFTNAARRARIPVVLGGHSLVAGGLYALVDAAWQAQGLPPR